MDLDYFVLFKIGISLVGPLVLLFLIQKALIFLEKKWSLVGCKKITFLPLIVLVWIVDLLYCLNVFDFFTKIPMVVLFLHTILKICIMGCLLWIFFRWKKRLISKELIAAYNNHALKIEDVRKIKNMDRLSAIFIICFGLFTVLQFVEIDIKPFLLTFGGIGAAALGFAGKDIIANFVGGFIIQLTAPFIPGSVILLPEKQVEGRVEELGFFYTTIRDKEYRRESIPNSLFLSSIIINSSMATHKTIKQTINVSFENTDKISLVTNTIYKTLSKMKQIDRSLPFQVVLRKFGLFAYEIDIEAHVKIIDQTKFNQFQQDVLLKVAADLKALGVVIAFPPAMCKIVI
jgi:MscS family membrane protein